MYEARQNKERVSRQISIDGYNTLMQNRIKQKNTTIQRIPNISDVYLGRLYDKGIGQHGIPYLTILHMALPANAGAVGYNIQHKAQIAIAQYVNHNEFNRLSQNLNIRIIIRARTLNPLDLFLYCVNLRNGNIVPFNIMNNFMNFLNNNLTFNMLNNFILKDVKNNNDNNPGKYQSNDSRYNSIITSCLLNNLFIQNLINNNVHANLPTNRNQRPIGGAVSVNNATDDRLMAATDLFNRLVSGVRLPNITQNLINMPQASMQDGGVMNIGWAVTRGNLLHELGHHLENNLSPLEFATLHSFLRARVSSNAMRQNNGNRNVGYFFENGTGYNIHNPSINAGIWWNATQKTPLRYLGMIGRDLIFQFGRLLSRMFDNRSFENVMSVPIDNFFVHNANNSQISYNSLLHQGGNSSSEYLSTTVEIFNHPQHLREFIDKDPLRIALFLYLANRPEFNDVALRFRQSLRNQVGPNPLRRRRVRLEKLIHVVK